MTYQGLFTKAPMSHPLVALWLAVVTLLGQTEPAWRSNWKFGPRLIPAPIAEKISGTCAGGDIQQSGT